MISSLFSSSSLWKHVLSVDVVSHIAHIHCHRTPGRLVGQSVVNGNVHVTHVYYATRNISKYINIHDIVYDTKSILLMILYLHV
jgi:hypothetical protein